MKKYQDYSKAPVMRTVNLPGQLWKVTKDTAHARKQPVRQFLERAVNRRLLKVRSGLEKLGMVQTASADKLVRLPLALDIAEQLRSTSQTLGLPAVRLLALCLYQEVGSRRLRLRSRGGGTPPKQK